MASKKELKKSVKTMIYDLMDECNHYLVTDSKNADKADKLMDEVAEYHNEIMTKINAAKVKADFKNIRTQLEDDAVAFVDKVNKLG